MFSKILKSVLGLYLLSSYKSLPLAYFVRFYYQLLKLIFLPTYFPSLRIKNEDKSPFQPSELKTFVSPFEVDFYMHKSNSTYFTELDIARTKLVSSLLQNFFINYPTKSGSYPYVPVASVYSNFKKEIKPFQKYRVESKILSWDSKWLFVYSKFLIKNGKKKQDEGEEITAATCLTKYVLKDGRKTIPPVEALKFCNLYTEEDEKKSAENMKFVEWFINNDQFDEL